MARIDWKAAMIAGLIAGLVFLILEMMLAWLVMGMSPWAPPRMMAAIVLGKEVLPPPASFDAAIVGVAMALHFALSIAFALVFALIAGRLGLWPAIAGGAIYGLAIYGIDFYGFTAIWPWFADARNWISILSHAVFGIVLAAAYKRLQGRAAAA